jgi:spermidine/putrescine transport system permease protein
MKQTTLARISLLPGTLWLIVLFIAPWAVVVAVSLATTNILGLPVYGTHFGNYSQIVQPQVLGVFGRSLSYAAIATAVCLLLGYTTAYTVARYGGRYRHLIILLALVPWLVDYLVRIYSWIQILGQGGVLNSLVHALGGNVNVDLLGHTYTVIGGLAYSYLPYMILAVYVSVEQLDDSVLEAGRDLYGSSRAVFTHVTLPCTLPGVLSGCLLVFLPAIGDFATAQLLGSPDQYMVGNIISNDASTPGGLPISAGLTVLLIGVLGVVALAYMAAARPLVRSGVMNRAG